MTNDATQSGLRVGACGLKPARRRRFAFTLVELIISIGLVLIIMLGVNYVFKMTGDTISAGQTLNENVRNSRASQAVMFEDFSRYASDSPALLIKSRTQLAFRNRADELSDRDYVESGTQSARNTAIVSVDLDGDGLYTGLGEQVTAAQYGNRNHRVDVISFFARGDFRRQTGGDVGGGGVANNAEPKAPLLSTLSSKEAWVWYGHLVLPNNDGTFTINNPPAAGTVKSNPGAATYRTNPNNFYASSWVLGRVAPLLIAPYDHDGSAASADAIADRDNNRQVFIGRDPGLPATSISLAPLSVQSSAYFQSQGGSTVQRNASNIELLDSRFDLVGTSITGYGQILTNAINNGSVNFAWWENMMSTVRFETNPFVTRPINAISYAQQAPIFIPGSTQFIVEFAGDFLKQNRDPNDVNDGGTGDALGRFGDVQDAFFVPATLADNPTGTDGEIDFNVTFVDLNSNGVLDANEVSTARKVTRWYGMPRDTSADGRIPGGGQVTPRSSKMPDVVPLRDLLACIGYRPAPFERDGDRTDNFLTSLPLKANYLDGSDPMGYGDDYTCAWGPSDSVRPKMIRITIVVDDPSGRLADGQTYEYVFTLPSAQ